METEPMQLLKICPLCNQTVKMFYFHVFDIHGSEALHKALNGEVRPKEVEGTSPQPVKVPKITVYYDGLCEPRNPRGVATYGFVVYEGRVRIGEGSGLAMARPWSNEASNNVAEYSAMINAFRWLLEHGYEDVKILVKGDNQLSIRQMRGSYCVKAPRIVPLYKEAKRLASKFRNVRFQWIPRNENKEADELSQLALRDYWRQYKAEKAEEVKSEEIIPLKYLKFNVRGYIVDLKAYTCVCPDYMRSNRNPRLTVKLPCKHILAVERHMRKLGSPEKS